MQLIIATSNTSITVKNNSFYITNETIKRQISPKRITSIAITTNCHLNASCIKLAAQNQVPIYFFDRNGQIEAKMYSPYFSNLADIRIAQLNFTRKQLAMLWIIEQIRLKTELQIQTINLSSTNNCRFRC